MVILDVGERKLLGLLTGFKASKMVVTLFDVIRGARNFTTKKEVRLTLFRYRLFRIHFVVSLEWHWKNGTSSSPVLVQNECETIYSGIPRQARAVGIGRNLFSFVSRLGASHSTTVVRGPPVPVLLCGWHEHSNIFTK